MHLYYSALVFLSIPFPISAFYDKSSPVLQVDAKSYNKLIAKSNYTSMVEFYAPWCGHCKNLKPAYEKAAKSLVGFAKVAAVDCDDESNKPFCGSMGVKGFPTLKIVKPSKKKGGKAIVEDYQGERTAKAINEAVVDKIANHVTRLKDSEFEEWLLKEPSKPKAVFFSDKGTVGLLPKALAIDFLGTIDFGYLKSSETQAMGKLGVTKAPAAVLIPPGSAATVFDGDLSKKTLLEFYSQAAAPNPDALSPTADKKPAAKKPKDPPAKPPAASETLEDTTNPTASPSPAVSSDSAPAPVPIPPTPAIPALSDAPALHAACLHAKAGTCVLAVLPGAAEDTGAGEAALASLAEIAHKHALRGAKMFPFYSIPGANAAGTELLTKLGAAAAPGEVRVLAVNAKRGWWSGFGGEGMGVRALEAWVDSIRFGEVRKETMPEGVVEEVREEAVKEEKKQEKEAEEVKEEKKAEEDVKEEEKAEAEPVVVAGEHDEL